MKDPYTNEEQGIYVNAANVYKLVFRTKERDAEQFTEWVRSEELPSKRKYGSYMNRPTTMHKKTE